MTPIRITPQTPPEDNKYEPIGAPFDEPLPHTWQRDPAVPAAVVPGQPTISFMPNPNNVKIYGRYDEPAPRRTDTERLASITSERDDLQTTANILAKDCDEYRAKIAAVEAERDAVRSEASGLRSTFDAWQADAAKLAAGFPGVEWSHVSDFVPHVNALRTERDRANLHLGNLLARIHRDGGHYQSAHGTEKAVEDADRIVAEMNVERDQLRAELAALLPVCRRIVARATVEREGITGSPVVVDVRRIADSDVILLADALAALRAKGGGK